MRRYCSRTENNRRLFLQCLAISPNITGSLVTHYDQSKGAIFGAAEGVLAVSNQMSVAVADLHVDSSRGYGSFAFNASLDNAIYAGSKVQQLALQCLPCIRF